MNPALNGQTTHRASTDAPGKNPGRRQPPPAELGLEQCELGLGGQRVRNVVAPGGGGCSVPASQGRHSASAPAAFS
jgi:hypothetical protein